MDGNSPRPDPRTAGDDLLILFPRGDRPTAGRVREIAAKNGLVDTHVIGLGSFDPALSGRVVAISQPREIALQRSGLVFDLIGLSPGPGMPIPDLGRDIAVVEEILPSRTDASSLRLGPHITAGLGNLTILREWFGLAHSIAAAFGASSLCWVPGGVVRACDRWDEALRAWDARGEVPVGLLANFRRTLDGAIQSEGLTHFTGQEFRIEPDLVDVEAEGLARLIFTHLYYAGRQDSGGELTSPEGYPLRLEISANGRFVRVWPG